MPRYELRLTLPDQPGAFGAVADALGRVGANIVSFEAVDVEHEVAVDQLVVDLDPDVANRVVPGLEAVEGVHVEAFRPVPRRPVFEGPLELIEAMVQLPPEEVLQTLVDGAPATLRVGWAVALAQRDPQPRRLAASVGSPSLVGAGTPWLPLPGARALAVDAAWVPRRWGLSEEESAAAAAPLDETGTAAVLVVRRQGPAFRRRELRGLAALTLVAGRLAAGAPVEDSLTTSSEDPS